MTKRGLVLRSQIAVSYDSARTLVRALSLSLTIAYFWHCELPIFLGATVGYTPSYDFTCDGSRPDGAFNAGLTLRVYVPLFDVKLIRRSCP